MARYGIQVEGLDDAVKALERLKSVTAKAELSELLLREAGQPLARDISTAAPRLTGATSRAVAAKTARVQPGAIVTVDMSRITRPGAEKSRYPFIVEEGAGKHVIRPKNAKALLIGGYTRTAKSFGSFTKQLMTGKYAERLYSGFARVVKHPGFKARRFFRDTVRAKQAGLSVRVTDALRRAIESVAKST